MKDKLKYYLEVSKVFIKHHLRFRDILIIAINQIISKSISLPFNFLSLVTLPIDWKVYKMLQTVNIKIQISINYFLYNERLIIEDNLLQILRINKNRDKIARLSLVNRNLQNELYSDLFFKLVRSKQYIAYGKRMKINNLSGIPLEKIGIEQKVIFCHSHSSHMIFTILKMGSMTNTKLNTLLVQRGYSKTAYSFLNSVAKSLEARNLEYYDPFQSNTTSLLRKVKNSNIIHLYVDLPIHTSLKNFSDTNIELFNKKAIVNDSAAKLALSFNAICIPVFTSKNEINILKPIEPNLLTEKDKQIKINKTMQSIFVQLSSYWLKYPQDWYLLGSAEYFFKITKFQ